MNLQFNQAESKDVLLLHNSSEEEGGNLDLGGEEPQNAGITFARCSSSTTTLREDLIKRKAQYLKFIFKFSGKNTSRWWFYSSLKKNAGGWLSKAQ